MPKLKEIFTKWQTELETKRKAEFLFGTTNDCHGLCPLGGWWNYRVKSARRWFCHSDEGNSLYLSRGRNWTPILPFTILRLKRFIDQMRSWSLWRGPARRSWIKSILVVGQCPTPMQWNDEAEAGLRTGRSWLAVNPNYKEITVDGLSSRSRDSLTISRLLIALSKDFLACDRWIMNWWTQQTRFLAYKRVARSAYILVVVNLSSQEQERHRQWGLKRFLLPIPK